MAYRPKDTQERILHRLKIAKGQLENVIKMVENDTYCIDILNQMQAVAKAIEQTEYVILENHLKTCAANAIRQGKQEEAIKEIMQIVKRSQ